MDQSFDEILRGVKSLIQERMKIILEMSNLENQMKTFSKMISELISNSIPIKKQFYDEEKCKTYLGFVDKLKFNMTGFNQIYLAKGEVTKEDGENYLKGQKILLEAIMNL